MGEGGADGLGKRPRPKILKVKGSLSVDFSGGVGSDPRPHVPKCSPESGLK